MNGMVLRAVLVAAWLSVLAAFPPVVAAQTIGCGEIRAFCFADQGDCPCDDYGPGGCANATGVGGILSANGSGSIALDDLVFTATQLPPNAPTVFFTNQIDARTPFRNGLLCLEPQGSKVLRIGVARPATGGEASEGPGVVSYLASEYQPPDGVLEPGDTWYVQCFYRDPGHCVSSANFTNAIAVTFAPEPPPGTARIGGRVYYDWNENGAFDVGGQSEGPIEGWRVELEGAGEPQVSFTDALGGFEFLVPKDGAQYVLRSAAPPPGFVPEPDAVWVETSDVEVPLTADAAEFCVDFGNFALENMPELNLTTAFWAFQGWLLLLPCEPEWRSIVNDLCLRTNVTNANGQEGTLFTIPLDAPFDEAVEALTVFLVEPTNGVLANQLSKEFCATNLNLACGNLQGTVYLDRNLDGVLISTDELVELTRGLLCDPCAANTGPGGDEECRAAIQMCLQEWEGTNSNGSRIYTKRSSPREFESPYLNVGAPAPPQ